jgi:hypothetical protein
MGILRKSKKTIRLISIIVSLSFLLSSISYAQGTVHYTANRIQNTGLLQTISNDTNKFRLDKLVIPEELGKIKEKWIPEEETKRLSKNNKTIIHIQDSHANYEAQGNIAKIIEYIISNQRSAVSGELKSDSRKPPLLIALEGAKGEIDTSIFNKIHDKDKRKEVLDSLTKEGILAGSEFYDAISQNKNCILWGVEDKEAYIDNVKSFKQIQETKKTAQEYIKQQTKTLLKQAKREWNKEQIEFYNKFSKYQNDEIGLEEYITVISRQSSVVSKKKNKLTNYNLRLTTNLINLKKHINFTKIESDRMDVLKQLKDKMVQEDFIKVIQEGLQYQVGNNTAVEYFLKLKQLMKEYRIKNNNLKYYFRYVNTENRIDRSKLFEEIKEIEETIISKTFNDEKTRHLFTQLYHLIILKKFTELRVYREDLQCYKNHKSDFLRVVSNKSSGVSNLKADVSRKPSVVSKEQETLPLTSFLNAFESFCDVGIKRDQILISNMFKKMDELGTDKAILITGGFHTEGMMDLLQLENCNYLVISPVMLKAGDKERYKDLVLNKKSVLDKIFAFTGTHLAPELTCAKESMIPENRINLENLINGDINGDTFQLKPISNTEGFKLKDGKEGLYVNGIRIDNIENGIEKRKGDIQKQADRIVYDINGKKVFVSEEFKTICEQNNVSLDWLGTYFREQFRENMPLANEVFIDLLNDSEYLFEDNTANGYIGINQKLFISQLVAINIKLLKIGIRHELKHEAGKTKTEDELFNEDIETIVMLGLNRKSINLLIAILDENYLRKIISAYNACRENKFPVIKIKKDFIIYEMPYVLKDEGKPIKEIVKIKTQQDIKLKPGMSLGPSFLIDVPNWVKNVWAIGESTVLKVMIFIGIPREWIDECYYSLLWKRIFNWIDVIEGSMQKDINKILGERVDGREKALQKYQNEDGVDESILNKIRMALNDQNAYVRKYAVEALGKHGSDKDIARLEGMVRDDTHGMVKNAALKALEMIKNSKNGEIHQLNVSCGNICESGHEGSYEALDAQLERQFGKLRSIYNYKIKAEEKTMHGLRLTIPEEGDQSVMTEEETDHAMVVYAKGLGIELTFEQLNDFRNEIKKANEDLYSVYVALRDVRIFFSIPETGTDLFWVLSLMTAKGLQNDYSETVPNGGYAGGHFNQKGTRIHISLPLILKRGIPAGGAIARHEMNHIVSILEDNPGNGHNTNDSGIKVVQEIAKVDKIRKRYIDLKENISQLSDDVEIDIIEKIFADVDELTCDEISQLAAFFRWKPVQVNDVAANYLSSGGKYFIKFFLKDRQSEKKWIKEQIFYKKLSVFKQPEFFLSIRSCRMLILGNVHYYKQGLVTLYDYLHNHAKNMHNLKTVVKNTAMKLAEMHSSIYSAGVFDEDGNVIADDRGHFRREIDDWISNKIENLSANGYDIHFAAGDFARWEPFVVNDVSVLNHGDFASKNIFVDSLGGEIEAVIDAESLIATPRGHDVSMVIISIIDLMKNDPSIQRAFGGLIRYFLDEYIKDSGIDRDIFLKNLPYYMVCQLLRMSDRTFVRWKNDSWIDWKIYLMNEIFTWDYFDVTKFILLVKGKIQNGGRDIMKLAKINEYDEQEITVFQGSEKNIHASIDIPSGVMDPMFGLNIGCQLWTNVDQFNRWYPISMEYVWRDIGISKDDGIMVDRYYFKGTIHPKQISIPGKPYEYTIRVTFDDGKNWKWNGVHGENRKIKVMPCLLPERKVIWDDFLEKEYQGLIADYDGVLSDGQDDYRALESLADRLTSGVPVAIATGRQIHEIRFIVDKMREIFKRRNILSNAANEIMKRFLIFTECNAGCLNAGTGKWEYKKMTDTDKTKVVEILNKSEFREYIQINSIKRDGAYIEFAVRDEVDMDFFAEILNNFLLAAACIFEQKQVSIYSKYKEGIFLIMPECFLKQGACVEFASKFNLDLSTIARVGDQGQKYGLDNGFIGSPNGFSVRWATQDTFPLATLEYGQANTKGFLWLMQKLKFKTYQARNKDSNIGKRVKFNINGNKQTISKRGKILAENIELKEEKLDYQTKERIMQMLQGLLAGEKYTNEIGYLLDKVKIMTFEGTEESRAAGALAHVDIDNKIVYIDRMLFEDMTIIHELLHIVLAEEWKDKEYDEILNSLPIRDKLRTRINSFVLYDDEKKGYLAHYYARFYLQNPKNGIYKGSENDKLTKKIADITGKSKERKETEHTETVFQILSGSEYYEKDQIVNEIQRLNIEIIGWESTPKEYLEDILKILKNVRTELLINIKQIKLVPWYKSILFWQGISGLANLEEGIVNMPILLNRKAFLSVFLHEVIGHLIVNNHAALSGIINGYSWEYDGDDWVYNPDSPWSFLSLYSATNSQEDQAEVSAALLIDQKDIKNEKLIEKLEKVKQFIFKDSFNFNEFAAVTDGKWNIESSIKLGVVLSLIVHIFLIFPAAIYHAIIPLLYTIVLHITHNYVGYNDIAALITKASKIFGIPERIIKRFTVKTVGILNKIQIIIMPSVLIMVILSGIVTKNYKDTHLETKEQTQLGFGVQKEYQEEKNKKNKLSISFMDLPVKMPVGEMTVPWGSNNLPNVYQLIPSFKVVHLKNDDKDILAKVPIVDAMRYIPKTIDMNRYEEAGTFHIFYPNYDILTQGLNIEGIEEFIVHIKDAEKGKISIRFWGGLEEYYSKSFIVDIKKGEQDIHISTRELFPAKQYDGIDVDFGKSSWRDIAIAKPLNKRPIYLDIKSIEIVPKNLENRDTSQLKAKGTLCEGGEQPETQKLKETDKDKKGAVSIIKGIGITLFAILFSQLWFVSPANAAGLCNSFMLSTGLGVYAHIAFGFMLIVLSGALYSWNDLKKEALKSIYKTIKDHTGNKDRNITRQLKIFLSNMLLDDIYEISDIVDLLCNANLLSKDNIYSFLRLLKNIKIYGDGYYNGFRLLIEKVSAGELPKEAMNERFVQNLCVIGGPVYDELISAVCSNVLTQEEIISISNVDEKRMHALSDIVWHDRGYIKTWIEEDNQSDSTYFHALGKLLVCLSISNEYTRGIVFLLLKDNLSGAVDSVARALTSAKQIVLLKGLVRNCSYYILKPIGIDTKKELFKSMLEILSDIDYQEIALIIVDCLNGLYKLRHNQDLQKEILEDIDERYFNVMYSLVVNPPDGIFTNTSQVLFDRILEIIKKEQIPYSQFKVKVGCKGVSQVMDLIFHLGACWKLKQYVNVYPELFRDFIEMILDLEISDPNQMIKMLYLSVNAIVRYLQEDSSASVKYEFESILADAFRRGGGMMRWAIVSLLMAEHVCLNHKFLKELNEKYGEAIHRYIHYSFSESIMQKKEIYVCIYCQQKGELQRTVNVYLKDYAFKELSGKARIDVLDGKEDWGYIPRILVKEVSGKKIYLFVFGGRQENSANTAIYSAQDPRVSMIVHRGHQPEINDTFPMEGNIFRFDMTGKVIVNGACNGWSESIMYEELYAKGEWINTNNSGRAAVNIPLVYWIIEGALSGKDWDHGLKEYVVEHINQDLWVSDNRKELKQIVQNDTVQKNDIEHYMFPKRSEDGMRRLYDILLEGVFNEGVWSIVKSFGDIFKIKEVKGDSALLWQVKENKSQMNLESKNTSYPDKETSHPDEGQDLKIKYEKFETFIPHPNNIEGSYSPEASNNLKKVLNTLGISAFSLILNLGCGRNPLKIDEYNNLINVDAYEPFNSYGYNYFIGDFIEKGFMDLFSQEYPDLKTRKPDVCVFYNMLNYMVIYSKAGDMLSGFLSPEVRKIQMEVKILDYIENVWKEILSYNGSLVFIEYMSPETGMTNSDNLALVEGMLQNSIVCRDQISEMHKIYDTKDKNLVGIVVKKSEKADEKGAVPFPVDNTLMSHPDGGQELISLIDRDQLADIALSVQKDAETRKSGRLFYGCLGVSIELYLRLKHLGITAEVYTNQNVFGDGTGEHLWVETKDYIIDAMPEAVIFKIDKKYRKEKVIVIDKKDGNVPEMYKNGVPAKNAKNPFDVEEYIKDKTELGKQHVYSRRSFLGILLTGITSGLLLPSMQREAFGRSHRGNGVLSDFEELEDVMNANKGNISKAIKYLFSQFDPALGLLRYDRDNGIYYSDANGKAISTLLGIGYEGSKVYARMIADRLITLQNNDGSWYDCYRSKKSNSSGENSKSLYCIMPVVLGLLDLYSDTENIQYYYFAERAVLWALSNCIVMSENQYIFAINGPQDDNILVSVLTNAYLLLALHKMHTLTNDDKYKYIAQAIAYWIITKMWTGNSFLKGYNLRGQLANFYGSNADTSDQIFVYSVLKELGYWLGINANLYNPIPWIESYYAEVLYNGKQIYGFPESLEYDGKAIYAITTAKMGERYIKDKNYRMGQFMFETLLNIQNIKTGGFPNNVRNGESSDTFFEDNQASLAFVDMYKAYLDAKDEENSDNDEIDTELPENSDEDLEEDTGNILLDDIENIMKELRGTAAPVDYEKLIAEHKRLIEEELTIMQETNESDSVKESKKSDIKSKLRLSVLIRKRGDVTINNKNPNLMKDETNTSSNIKYHSGDFVDNTRSLGKIFEYALYFISSTMTVLCLSLILAGIKKVLKTRDTFRSNDSTGSKGKDTANAINEPVPFILPRTIDEINSISVSFSPKDPRLSHNKVHVNTDVPVFLAWIENTRVALRFNSNLPDYLGAITMDKLGVGPKFYGRYTDEYENHYIVTDIIPGDFIESETNKKNINLNTIYDWIMISNGFKENGIYTIDKPHYFITPEGKVQILDVGIFNKISGENESIRDTYIPVYDLYYCITFLSFINQFKALLYIASNDRSLFKELNKYCSDNIIIKLMIRIINLFYISGNRDVAPPVIPAEAGVLSILQDEKGAVPFSYFSPREEKSYSDQLQSPKAINHSDPFSTKLPVLVMDLALAGIVSGGLVLGILTGMGISINAISSISLSLLQTLAMLLGIISPWFIKEVCGQRIWGGVVARIASLIGYPRINVFMKTPFTIVVDPGETLKTKGDYIKVRRLQKIVAGMGIIWNIVFAIGVGYFGFFGDTTSLINILLTLYACFVNFSIALISMVPVDSVRWPIISRIRLTLSEPKQSAGGIILDKDIENAVKKYIIEEVHYDIYGNKLNVPTEEEAIAIVVSHAGVILKEYNYEITDEKVRQLIKKYIRQGWLVKILIDNEEEPVYGLVLKEELALLREVGMVTLLPTQYLAGYLHAKKEYIWTGVYDVMIRDNKIIEAYDINGNKLIYLKPVFDFIQSQGNVFIKRVTPWGKVYMHHRSYDALEKGEISIKDFIDCGSLILAIGNDKKSESVYKQTGLTVVQIEMLYNQFFIKGNSRKMHLLLKIKNIDEILTKFDWFRKLNYILPQADNHSDEPILYRIKYFLLMQNAINEEGGFVLGLLLLADKCFNLFTEDNKDKAKKLYGEIMSVWRSLYKAKWNVDIARDFLDKIFCFSMPEEYKQIADEVKIRVGLKHSEKDWMSRIRRELDVFLKRVLENGNIEGRSKSIVSIWYKLEQEKTNRNSFTMSDISDFVAFRIVVKEYSDIYNVAKLLMSKKGVKYLKKMFNANCIELNMKYTKNYIQDDVATIAGVPIRHLKKESGYESLHMVFTVDGYNIEFQIRDERMHEKSERGDGAGHAMYKMRGRGGKKIKVDQHQSVVIFQDHDKDEILMILSDVRALLDSMGDLDTAFIGKPTDRKFRRYTKGMHIPNASLVWLKHDWKKIEKHKKQERQKQHAYTKLCNKMRENPELLFWLPAEGARDTFNTQRSELFAKLIKVDPEIALRELLINSVGADVFDEDFAHYNIDNLLYKYSVDFTLAEKDIIRILINDTVSKLNVEHSSLSRTIVSWWDVIELTYFNTHDDYRPMIRKVKDLYETNKTILSEYLCKKYLTRFILSDAFSNNRPDEYVPDKRKTVLVLDDTILQNTDQALQNHINKLVEEYEKDKGNAKIIPFIVLRKESYEWLTEKGIKIPEELIISNEELCSVKGDVSNYEKLQMIVKGRVEDSDVVLISKDTKFWYFDQIAPEVCAILSENKCLPISGEGRDAILFGYLAEVGSFNDLTYSEIITQLNRKFGRDVTNDDLKRIIELKKVYNRYLETRTVVEEIGNSNKSEEHL